MKKFITTVLLLSLISCATEKPEGKTQAEVLYKEAKILMDDERFILATEKLNEIKNKHPYSYYATPAELLLADILYLQESYVESAAAYMLFRDLHPKHEKIAYVIYKIAQSFDMQIPETFDRDLDAAVEAIKYYNELLTKYPNSEYVKDAQPKIKKAKKMLQDKEKYIADFYFKTEVYDAAIWRYKDILLNFADKDLRSHSSARIIQSMYHLNKYEDCINYANSNYQGLVKSDKKIVDTYKSYCEKQKSTN